MKQKLKRNKGITLIALILTIIVLLILAVVAISTVMGEGIISHAKNARNDYTKAQANEQARLDEYSDYLDTESSKMNGGKTGAKTLKDNLNKELSTTANTPLTDDFGNKIKVPAGFKIITKTETENTDLNYTADTIDVTKGIVVEDEEGNQFVWIPVGTIYTNTEKTASKTIKLGRYESFEKTNNAYTVAQNASDYGTEVDISSYREDTTESHSSSLTNSIANNIGDFCTKSNSNGGYYIGRYEARTGTERETGEDTLTPVTLKANDYVYNWITQPKASERCQSMYTNKPFKSDLVNSYAWDTAIIFLQEFGETSDYASKTSVNSSLANTGTSGTSYTGTKDVICNVYDMASNCWEWTTETYYGWASAPATGRGGTYQRGGCTSRRGSNHEYEPFVDYSFRPVLYM